MADTSVSTADHSTIASLMMYARPELVDAHAQFWALIRAGLLSRDIDSPEQLSQDAEEFSVWTHPGLVLSQTCGMPYRLFLHARVSLVGTPDYALEACPPGYYRSAFVVHRNNSRTRIEQFREAQFAFNQVHSQSGFAAPYQHLRTSGFWFARGSETGSHLNSARAVARGQADIACIDAVTWRLLMQHDAFAAQLRVLEWTRPTPGLPYISAQRAEPAAIFAAVQQAISDLPAESRQQLGIRTLVNIDKAAYLAVPNPPGSAQFA